MLLLVHAPAQREQPDLLLWEALHDFTPAQSRVAQEVYQGKSISEGAQSLQISEATFKTHLSEVFRKTGVRGQAKLVSLLATLQGL